MDVKLEHKLPNASFSLELFNGDVERSEAPVFTIHDSPEKALDRKLKISQVKDEDLHSAAPSEVKVELYGNLQDKEVLVVPKRGRGRPKGDHESREGNTPGRRYR